MVMPAARNRTAQMAGVAKYAMKLIRGSARKLATTLRSAIPMKRNPRTVHGVGSIYFTAATVRLSGASPQYEEKGSRMSCARDSARNRRMRAVATEMRKWGDAARIYHVPSTTRESKGGVRDFVIKRARHPKSSQGSPRRVRSLGRHVAADPTITGSTSASRPARRQSTDQNHGQEKTIGVGEEVDSAQRRLRASRKNGRWRAVARAAAPRTPRTANRVLASATQNTDPTQAE